MVDVRHPLHEKALAAITQLKNEVLLLACWINCSRKLANQQLTVFISRDGKLIVRAVAWN
jgi:hypothetical protein